MFTIRSADTEALLQQAVALSQEYVDWMRSMIREQYPALDLAAFTAAHDYEDVRKKFPGEHVPPYGRLFVAMRDSQASGCIALARLSDSVCEMRTLYVRPAYRGMGLGKELAARVISEARAIGYTHMRLDTLRFMESAHRLYRSLGFDEIPPYGAVPDALKPYIRFLELELRTP